MAVVVIYSVPGLPGFGTSTTPPTSAQMANLNAVVATITYADGDSLGTITHNMQIPTASLALGVPFVSLYPNLLGTGPLPILGSLLNSNTVLMTKTAATFAGSNGTYTVTVLKPNTLME